MASRKKLTFTLSEDCEKLIDAVGNKGANLAKLINKEIPIPPGFVLTTYACERYFERYALEALLWKQVKAQMKKLELIHNKIFGSVSDPLLVSVRSSPVVSMPGMLETVLHVGLTEEMLNEFRGGRIQRTRLWFAYVNLIEKIGICHFEINPLAIKKVINKFLIQSRNESVGSLGIPSLRKLSNVLKQLIHNETDRYFSDNAYDQLKMAITSVFDSWNSHRTRMYRKREKIPDRPGTAIVIMSMIKVLNQDQSGSGVIYSRNPMNGGKMYYGEYLPGMPGDMLMSGERTPKSLDLLQKKMPDRYAEITKYSSLLEKEFANIQEIEFVIQNRKLWILQCRNASCTIEASINATLDFYERKWINLEELRKRISRSDLDSVQSFHFNQEKPSESFQFGQGIPASSNVAVGVACFEWARVAEMKRIHKYVIFIRPQTKTDDFKGIVDSDGLMTLSGGATCHAAVLARQYRKPCIVGCTNVSLDEENKQLQNSTGEIVKEGDWISLDGNTGEIWNGILSIESTPSKIDKKRIVNLLDQQRFNVGNLLDKSESRYAYKCVMLVDDNLIDNLINEKIIEANKFAKQILVFYFANEALDYLIQYSNNLEELPQIIFLDINMPIMDGFQFLEDFGDLPDTVHEICKIIMLSSSISPKDIDRAASNRYVKKYLNKPLNMRYLETITI